MGDPMNNRKYIPARLRQARVSRGLSMAELANELEVTRQAISQYEIGTIEPSEFVLRKYVDTLKYPLDYFKKPMPDFEGNFASSTIYYRKQKGATVKLKEASEQRLDQFAEIDMYFRNFVDIPGADLPKISMDDYSEDGININAEEVAKSLREYWNLGDYPITNLSLLLEKKGFMISTMKNNHKKIDAFSRWYKNGVPYIFYGSDNLSSVRYRFDLAHELGHLIMHSHITEEDMNVPEVYSRIEDEANIFAGAFLLPASSFSSEIYSTSIEHFLMLKKKWKVSISAMIYRIANLNIFSDSQLQYLKNQMTQRKYWHREPYDDTMEMEKPVILKQALNILLDNNIISKEQFLNDNPYQPEELENMCFLDTGTLNVLNSLNSKVVMLKR